ncbi:hypothetical protein BH11BAC5_BH11BAC5_44610 [soil metagenome]
MNRNADDAEGTDLKRIFILRMDGTLITRKARI